MAAPRWSGIGRNFVGNRYPFAVDDPGLREVVVFHGHALSASLKVMLPGARIREAVMLRDPVGWFVSMYNFRLKRQAEGIGPRVPPFADWYRAERKNPIARFLLYRYLEHGVPGLYSFSSRGQLRTIEAALCRFWFVGSYRAVGELTDRIAAETGVAGSPEPRNVDDVRAVTADTLPEALRPPDRGREPHRRIAPRAMEGPEVRSPRNPSPATDELPGGDQAAILLREAETGARKMWLRHIRGFNRSMRVPGLSGSG